MKGPTSVFACGVLLVLATGDTAAAKCVFTEPEYVATIVVRECADAVTFGLKRLGSPGFEWVATYCDVLPSYEPACVLEMDSLAALPRELRVLLEAE